MGTRGKHTGIYNIGVVGVPFKKGQTKDGVDKGPKVLRDENLIEDLTDLHCVGQVTDFGDVTYTPLSEKSSMGSGKYNCRNLPHVAACSKAISDKVKEVLSTNRLCINLGGDHSMGIGTVHGTCAAKGIGNVAVLWVDAHADLNTLCTSDTGNMHGMPVSLLCKETRELWPKKVPGMEWFEPCISVKDIAYIGLRDIDVWERVIMEKHDIAAYDMHQVDVHGINKVLEMALKRIDPDGTKSIHVSFDIDGVDSSETPSTGTPVRGGLTLREGIRVMEHAFDTGRLTTVDLVEVNPEIGTEQQVKQTTYDAKLLLLSACGLDRKGVVSMSTTIPTVE